MDVAFVKLSYNCLLIPFELFVLASMKLYSKKLTTFEQAEILDFPEVWFLGLNAKKIEGVPGAPMNNGKLSSI